MHLPLSLQRGIHSVACSTTHTRLHARVSRPSGESMVCVHTAACTLWRGVHDGCAFRILSFKVPPPSFRAATAVTPDSLVAELATARQLAGALAVCQTAELKKKAREWVDNLKAAGLRECPVWAPVQSSISDKSNPGTVTALCSNCFKSIGDSAV